MRESRFIKIHDRIITLPDVRKLSKLIWNDYKKKKESKKDRVIAFSAKCEDGSSFSSGNADIFDDDSVIALKRVKSISMSYWEYDSNSQIRVELSHGDSNYQNTISVEGNDSKWVNGTLKMFEETLASFTPQNTFIKKYRQLVISIFALGIGSLYMGFVNFSSFTNLTVYGRCRP